MSVSDGDKNNKTTNTHSNQNWGQEKTHKKKSTKKLSSLIPGKASVCENVKIIAKFEVYNLIYRP